MGGESRSSQSTASNQSTTNLVNDGEFAGASGISIDESDKSVNDSNNLDYSLDQEIDNSTNDSNNVDYSLETEYDYSGENSGNSGTINVTTVDGGAIKLAGEISKEAIKAAQEQSATNAKLVENSLNSSLGFGKEALKTVSTTTSVALKELSDTAKESLEDVSEFSGKAISTVSDSLTAQSEEFATGLTALSSSSLQLSQKILSDASQANTDDKAIISELAKSTSLAGQDLVASASQKMVLYIAVAIGVVGVAVAVVSAGKK